jgi:Rieske Fe-S protein
VAGLDRCTHLCCYPGWHVVTNPPPQRDYIGSPPTYEVYHEDPIYCVCHGTQYDPLEVIADTNPYNGVLFPGMRLVHGPGTFAMPLIPLRAVNEALEGGMADSRWYQHC